MWNNARALNATASALVLAVLVATVYVGGHWLIHRPQFALRAVRVDGETGGLRHVDIATVRAQAMPAIHGNFFTVNLETVRQTFEGVAWVRHARVRREWPNRLVVNLEEHEALGIWNDDRLLNTFGEVFSANLAEAEADGPLPLFYGPEGSSPEVRQRYADLTQWFAVTDLRPIELALSARYAWTLHLAEGPASASNGNGLTVELGREDDASTLYDRVARLIAAYPEAKSRWPKVSFLDMRYPNGFALRAEGMNLAGAAAPPAPTATEAAAHVPAHAAVAPHSIKPVNKPAPRRGPQAHRVLASASEQV